MLFVYVYVYVYTDIYVSVDEERTAAGKQPVMRSLSRDEQTTRDLEFLCVGGTCGWVVLAHIVLEL